MSSKVKSVRPKMKTQMKSQVELEMRTGSCRNDALECTSSGPLHVLENNPEGGDAENCLSTTINDNHVSIDESSREQLKLNYVPCSVVPDPGRSNVLMSYRSTRERNELLNDVRKFDTSTLKPASNRAKSANIPTLDQSITQEIRNGMMICWKNGIHPNDPLAEKFKDKIESDSHSEDDDSDVDEWDD